MSPEYRLFHSPGACSLAPHIVLEELGIAYEPVRVVIAEGANRKPEYLGINPRGRVPALGIKDEQGERVLTESVAIAVYLARRHPSPSLLPEDPGAIRTGAGMDELAGDDDAPGRRPHRVPPGALPPPPPTSPQSKASPRPAARRSASVMPISRNGSPARPGRWAMHSPPSTPFCSFITAGATAAASNMRKDYPTYAALMDRVRARPAVARAVAHEAIQID